MEKISLRNSWIVSNTMHISGSVRYSMSQYVLIPINHYIDDDTIVNITIAFCRLGHDSTIANGLLALSK